MRHSKFLALSAVIAAALLTTGMFTGGLLASPANAPTGDDPAPSAATALSMAAPPVPLLWKLSHDDNTVHLLGSFHLLKDDDYPLSDDIDSAFEAADRVVFEVPPEQLSDPALGQKLLAAAAYEDGGTLSEVLPAAMREKFNRILAGSGSSIAQFDQYQPWFVNLSLVLGISQSLGFSGENGLDQHLMRQAAEAGKPTAGLETIDDQLQMLDSTPMDEQIASLAEFIDDPQEVPAMLTELHLAWRQGDLDALDRLTVEEMREKTPESYRLINVERNDDWVPQIRRMLDQGQAQDTLVVVGALHLLGEDGVVEKLRAKGYTVERVCSACEREAVGAGVGE